MPPTSKKLRIDFSNVMFSRCVKTATFIIPEQQSWLCFLANMEVHVDGIKLDMLEQNLSPMNLQFVTQQDKTRPHGHALISPVTKGFLILVIDFLLSSG